MRAMLPRVLVLVLLLPPAARAWEVRVGAGPSAKREYNNPNGVNFGLGLQNRIGRSPLYFRGELAGSHYESLLHSMAHTPNETWIYQVDRPWLMLGSSMVLQVRPGGRWSPYALGGLGYYFEFYDLARLVSDRSVESSNWTSRSWGVNYGGGLQAKIGGKTEFLELRWHYDQWAQGMNLTFGV